MDENTALAYNPTFLPPMHGSYPDLPEPDLPGTSCVKVDVYMGDNRAIMIIPASAGEVHIAIHRESINILQRDEGPYQADKVLSGAGTRNRSR